MLHLWPGPIPGSHPNPHFSQDFWLPKHFHIWDSVCTRMTCGCYFVPFYKGRN